MEEDVYLPKKEQGDLLVEKASIALSKIPCTFLIKTMTKISLSDVRKVAKLARLEITDDQVQAYKDQLEAILDYVDQLKEIDTKNISPTTRAVEVVNAMREDSVEVNYSREEILNQAPLREGDFFRVPKIL